MANWPGQSQLLLSDKHRIRTLFPNSGTISTLVGSKEPGFLDDQGTSAMFSTPAGIAVGQVCDTSCLDLALVADSDNHRIRRVALLAKDVTTIAGSGISGFSNGLGTYAKFSYPTDVVFDENSSYVLIADSGNNRIRKMVLSTTEVTTFSGTSVQGFVDGSSTSARFNKPRGLALAPDGNTLYIADSGNHAVRAISMDGSVRTVAGSGMVGSADGTGTNSTFHFPSGITSTPDGNTLLVSDTWNNRIRSIDVTTGHVFTLAGSGSRGFLSEGTDVAFAHPAGIFFPRFFDLCRRFGEQSHPKSYIHANYRQ